MNNTTPTNTEPLWTAAGMTAGVSAIIALLVSFGIDLTEAQSVAILGVVGIFGPAIVALVARRKVTPNAKVVAFKAKSLPDARHSADSVQAGDASVLPTGTPVEVTELPRAA